MPAIPITVKGGNLPLNFQPTASEYATAFFRRLQIDIDGDRVLLGSTDGTEPTYNAGPWLNNGKWMAWDNERAKYVPVGVNISTNSSTYSSSENFTANRTITVPDATGTAALLTDVYVPRETILLSGTAPNIDWDLSSTFMMRLSGNTTITFSNIDPAQKIMVVLINPGTDYTVTWPATTRWPGGAAPVQPVGTAGQNAVGIYILRESNVTGASLIYGDAGSASAPSLTVSTGGPETVDPEYGGGDTGSGYPTQHLP